jgi:hypothetical protein
VDSILANPALCASLESFNAEVFRPSAKGFLRLVSAMPKLRVFKTCSDNTIGGEELIALFEHCPDLEKVSVCGNDKVMGRLENKGLAAFAKRKDLATKLREIVLYDQSFYDGKKFSKQMKDVRVFTGETEGDGIAAQVRPSRVHFPTSHEAHSFVDDLTHDWRCDELFVLEWQRVRHEYILFRRLRLLLIY